MMCCATFETRSDHLVQKLSDLSACNISTSVHLKCCSSDLFKSVPSHLLSSSQPLAYCHMHSVWPQTFVAPSCVSISPTLLRLRNHCFTFMYLNSCNALLFMTCYHVIYT